MNTKNVREEQLDLLSAMLGSSPETEQAEAITRETVQSSETIEVDKTCEIKNNTEPCEKLEFKRFSDYGDKIKDLDFYKILTQINPETNYNRLITADYGPTGWRIYNPSFFDINPKTGDFVESEKCSSQKYKDEYCPKDEEKILELPFKYPGWGFAVESTHFSPQGLFSVSQPLELEFILKFHKEARKHNFAVRGLSSTQCPQVLVAAYGTTKTKKDLADAFAWYKVLTERPNKWSLRKFNKELQGVRNSVVVEEARRRLEYTSAVNNLIRKVKPQDRNDEVTVHLKKAINQLVNSKIVNSKNKDITKDILIAHKLYSGELLEEAKAHQKKLWQEREDKKQAALDRGDILDQEAWAKSYEIKKPSLKEYSKYLKENNCYNQSTCPQPSSMYDKDGDIKLDKINSAALTAIFGTLIGTIYYTLSSERIQENDTILQPLVTSEEKEIPNIFSREFKYLTNPYLGAKFSLKVDRVNLKGKKGKKILPTWTFMQRYILYNSPHHGEAGTARSNVYHHGLRHFLKAKAEDLEVEALPKSMGNATAEMEKFKMEQQRIYIHDVFKHTFHFFRKYIQENFDFCPETGKITNVKTN